MSVFSVGGQPDTFIAKALQRVYAAFMVPEDKTYVYRFDYKISEFLDDPQGDRLEDYIYRCLGKALRQMGKRVGGIGMPQLRVELLDTELTILWRIPTRMADVRLHGMIQEQTEIISRATDRLQEGSTPAVREILAAVGKLTDEGLTFGMIQETNERADAQLDADPPEVPQPEGQG